tara:strand:- start:20265 stop:20597 length:333 start_codon:yes stop_codon:yes gene_type:complete
MKNIKTWEIFNEGFFNKKNTISFYSSKAWDISSLERKLVRVKFNVDKIEDDIIYLSSKNPDDKETIELNITTTDGFVHGSIKLHMRNGHKMKQTYNIDDITTKQIRKALK